MTNLAATHPVPQSLEPCKRPWATALPNWLFATGFCVALALAITCLAGCGVYLYQFQRGSQAAIGAVLASNKDTSQATQVLSLTAQMYVARILLLSCGIMCGMAFGFLGFALFLLGIKGDMDADGSHGDLKLRLLRLSPGAFVLACSMGLIGYCAVPTLPFDFRQPAATTGEKPAAPAVELPDSKADEAATAPL